MSEPGELARVREGMEVVDRGGKRVGTVAEVRAGDPGTVTAEGQEETDTSAFDAFVGSMLDRELHEQARARFARLGYVRIDAAGLFQGDRFAAADEVARIEGDTVHLTVDADSLLG